MSNSRQSTKDTPRRQAQDAIDLLKSAVLEIVKNMAGQNTSQIAKKLGINMDNHATHHGWIAAAILKELEMAKKVENKKKNKGPNSWVIRQK